MAKIESISEFIKAFTEGKTKNLESFRSYRVYDYGDLQVLEYLGKRKTGYRYNPHLQRNEDTFEKREELLAYRFSTGDCIYNANQLRHAGKGTTYATMDREGQSNLQKLIQSFGAVPIPFTLFTESKLDPREFEWIVKPVAETVQVTITKDNFNYTTRTYDKKTESINRHFVGAAIFKIEDEIFFFDVDRQELAHGIFNPFITKLPKLASSIKSAYELLMPEEVKEAIKAGTDVQRQGEFFFIKVSDEEFPVDRTLSKEEKEVLKFIPSQFGFGITDYISRQDHDILPENRILSPQHEDYQKAAIKYQNAIQKTNKGDRGTIGKTSSGSHEIERYISYDGITYASGKISQRRREHADQTLVGWYKVLANTGVASWTIRGNID